MAATAWYIASIVYGTVWTRPDTLATVVVDQNRLEPGHALLLTVRVSVAAGVPVTTGSFFTVTLRQRNGNAKRAVASYVSSAPGNLTHTFRWNADDDLTYIEAPYTSTTSTGSAAAFTKSALLVSSTEPGTFAFFYSGAGSYAYNQLNRTVPFTTPGTVLANSASATTFVASSTRMEQGFYAASALLRAGANSASTVVVGDQIAVELNCTTPVAGFSTATVKAAYASAPRTAANFKCNAANPTSWTDATRTLLASAVLSATKGPALLNQNFFKPTFSFTSSPPPTQMPFNGTLNAADNDFTGVYNAVARTIDLNSTTKNLASSLLVGTRIAGPNVDADTYIVAINTTSYANLITLNKALLPSAPAAAVSFAPALYSSTGLAAGATQFRAQSGLSYVGVGSPLLRVNGIQLESVSPRIYVAAVDANVITLSAPLSSSTSFPTLLIELDFVNVGRYDPFYRLRMMDLFTFNNCGVKNDTRSTNADGTINVSAANQLFLGVVVDGEGDTQFVQADVGASATTLTNVVGPALNNDAILYSPLLPADAYFEATFVAGSSTLQIASGTAASAVNGALLVNAALPWGTKAVSSTSYSVTANFTAGKTQFAVTNSPFSGAFVNYTQLTVLFGSAPGVGAALSSSTLNPATRITARTGSGGPGSILTLSTTPFRAAVVTNGATSTFQMASGTRPLVGYVVYSAQTGYVTVNAYPTDSSFGVRPAVAYTPASTPFVADISADNLFTVSSGSRPEVGDYIRSAPTGPLTVLTTPGATSFTVAQSSGAAPFGPAAAVAFTNYTSAFSTMPTRVDAAAADDFRPSVVVGDVLTQTGNFLITGARVAAVNGTLVTMVAPALASATAAAVSVATVTMTNAALKTDDNTRVTVPTYVVSSTAPATFTASLAASGLFTVTAGTRPAVGTALVSNLTAVVTVASTPAANTFTVTPNGGWGTHVGISFTTGYSATLSRAASFAGNDASFAVRSPVGVFTPPNIARNLQIAKIANTNYRIVGNCAAGSDIVSAIQGNPAVGDELVNAAVLPPGTVVTQVFRTFVADVSASSTTLTLAPDVNTLTIAVGAKLSHAALPPAALVVAVDDVARTVQISAAALASATGAVVTLQTLPAARISAVAAASASAADLAVAAGPPLQLSTVYGDYIDSLDPAYGVTPPYVIFLQHVFRTGDLNYAVNPAAAAKSAQILTTAFQSPLARTLKPDISAAAPATYGPFTFLSEYFFNAANGLVSNSTSEPWQYPKILNPDDSTAPYIYNFCTLAILNNVVADFLTNPENTTSAASNYCRSSRSAKRLIECTGDRDPCIPNPRTHAYSARRETYTQPADDDAMSLRRCASSERRSALEVPSTCLEPIIPPRRTATTFPATTRGVESDATYWNGLGSAPQRDIDVARALQTLFAQLHAQGIHPADVTPDVRIDENGCVVAVLP